ncbi:transposase [Bradyrhizobium sp. LMG 9283]|uniref:transposase n=1 Tax=Bradyrhizobium sp. LMG 9283 TaxID=592064 RepID=UPI00388D7360
MRSRLRCFATASAASPASYWLRQVFESLYAHGLNSAEIQGHLAELYEAEVLPPRPAGSSARSSTKCGDCRPLDAIYPVVFFDALRGKLRNEDMIKTKRVPRGRLRLRRTSTGDEQLQLDRFGPD